MNHLIAPIILSPNVTPKNSYLSALRPDEGCSPSEYYNHSGCVHPPAVYQQRSTSADLGEFPPYPRIVFNVNKY